MIYKSLEFFNLSSEFTLVDLENAKKLKINDIKNYQLKPEYESLLLHNVQTMYKILKNELYTKHVKLINTYTNLYNKSFSKFKRITKEYL